MHLPHIRSTIRRWYIKRQNCLTINKTTINVLLAYRLIVRDRLTCKGLWHSASWLLTSRLQILIDSGNKSCTTALSANHELQCMQKAPRYKIGANPAHTHWVTRWPWLLGMNHLNYIMSLLLPKKIHFSTSVIWPVLLPRDKDEESWGHVDWFRLPTTASINRKMWWVRIRI